MTLAKISLHCILRIQIWSQTYVNLKPEKSDVNIKRVWYFYQLFFNLKVKFRAVASKWCKSMQNQAERKKGRYETLKKVKQDIRDNIFNLQHHLCSYKMTRHKPPKVNLKNNSSVYICIYIIYIYIYIYIYIRVSIYTYLLFWSRTPNVYSEKPRKVNLGSFWKIQSLSTSDVSDLSFSRIYFSNNFTTDSQPKLQTGDLPRSLVKITIIVISLFKVDQLHKYSETKKIYI